MIPATAATTTVVSLAPTTGCRRPPVAPPSVTETTASTMRPADSPPPPRAASQPLSPAGGHPTRQHRRDSGAQPDCHQCGRERTTGVRRKRGLPAVTAVAASAGAAAMAVAYTRRPLRWRAHPQQATKQCRPHRLRGRVDRGRRRRQATMSGGSTSSHHGRRHHPPPHRLRRPRGHPSSTRRRHGTSATRIAIAKVATTANWRVMKPGPRRGQTQSGGCGDTDAAHGSLLGTPFCSGVCDRHGGGGAAVHSTRFLLRKVLGAQPQGPGSPACARNGRTTCAVVLRPNLLGACTACSDTS